MVSWFFVILWSVIIYSTIPFARSIQGYVEELCRRQVFEDFVIACGAAALGGLALYIIRSGSGAVWRRMLWLAAAGTLWLYCVKRYLSSPEEALHFFEYGILGLLIFRAQSHHTRDYGIYACSALIGAVVGIGDEAVQWIAPGRYWDMRDILINSFSGGLMQVVIAKSIRPSLITPGMSAQSVQQASLLTVIIIMLCGLALANTPARVAWYAERVPGLKFLRHTESVMTEYGYRHIDVDIGTFFSRMPQSALKQEDKIRHREVAGIIDSYKDHSRYIEFLHAYPPVVDPFTHEARVHLFRRDYHLQKQYPYGDDNEKKHYHCTIAYRENQIIEKYFRATLHSSRYVLPAEIIGYLEARTDKQEAYISRVSTHLITRFSEVQLLALIGLAAGVGMMVNRYCAKHTRRSRTGR